MSEKSSVGVLFLGTLSHQNLGQLVDKNVSQDEIKFKDPVQVELLRIPHYGRNLYNKLTSKTQKQTIKSFDVYYRNLNKKSAKFEILCSSSSDLLVSSSSDILIPVKEPIYSDLLVIRGNFSTLSLCVYGRVITDPEIIEKKCPYFLNHFDFPIKDLPSQIKITRNVFEQSRCLVKAIEDEYSDQNAQSLAFGFQDHANDSYLHKQQIKNITSYSADLQKYEDLKNVEQTQIAIIRKNLQEIHANLSKIFKSGHIGLYYPPGHRPSSIPHQIPTSIIKILTQLLSLDLSDQFRALEVLKLLLQLKPHAKFFVHLNGVEELIRLFLEFYCPSSVIFSSLKSLIIQVLIALSFWDFSVCRMVEQLPKYQQDFKKSFQSKDFLENLDDQKSLSKQKSRERSREKKKKKDSHDSRSVSRKKDKKNKKHKNKEKDRKKGKSVSMIKEKRSPSKFDKKTDNQYLEIQNAKKFYSEIGQCPTFYEILFRIMKSQKNSKLLQLLKILIQQITQTLTKDVQLSEQMARYTPLLRDTKYMFSQGGQMIGSKPIKIFSSFKPFLNQQQSRGVDCQFICELQKIKNPSKHHISLKLLKMIDAAIAIFQARGLNNLSNVQYYDEEFLTLLSSLIKQNTHGVTIGINYFIDAIKIEELGTIKKNQAVLTLIFQYLYEVFLECNVYTLVFYMDQIYNALLKYITHLGMSNPNRVANTSQDKNYSRQFKDKLNNLINLVLTYNTFNATESTFKGLTENFIKLFNYDHFQITKIADYAKKEYLRSLHPLSHLTLSEAFNLGNFHELNPKQPLLQIDVCLKIFLVLLKFNKNIWTTFYEYKLVSAFSCLYMKIHSLIKFFLTPSLERQNVIVELKQYERIVESYLRVGQDLTQIFIEKVKYQSAFNQLSEEEEIFNSVELYEKWFDMYLVLYQATHKDDCIINTTKIKQKIQIILAHIIEIFDTVLMSYEITKNSSRQAKIRSLLSHAYKNHFENMRHRAGILSFFKTIVEMSGSNTLEIIKSFFSNKFQKKDQAISDVLLPDNEKSVLQNIIMKNIYRIDKFIVNNMAELLKVLLSKSTTKDITLQSIDSIIFQHEGLLKEDIEQTGGSILLFEKNILCINLFASICSPLSQKIDEHILRYLKFVIGLRTSSHENSEAIQVKKLKLKKSLLSYFHNVFSKDSRSQLFLQFLKISTNFINLDNLNDSRQFRKEQLNTCMIILEIICKAMESCYYQSIFLFGEFLESPSKPLFTLPLGKLFNIFVKNKLEDFIDEQEQEIIKQIGIVCFYILCKLTTIDSSQFYSTECRKNALNCLVSSEKQYTIADVISSLENILPRQMVTLMKNYLAFPIREKTQTIIEKAHESQVKSIGGIYSKSVFSMISQNDPIGKTRFQFVQDKWQGGDVSKKIFSVNRTKDYKQLTAKVTQINELRSQYIDSLQFKYTYRSENNKKKVNKLFLLRIKKNFTLKKSTTIPSQFIIKNNIPEIIIRPEQIKKQMPKIYSQLTQDGQGMNNMSMSPSNHTQPIYNPTTSPTLARGISNNNRSPSPYTAGMNQQTIHQTSPGYTNPNYSMPPSNVPQPSPRNMNVPQQNLPRNNYNNGYNNYYGNNQGVYDNQPAYYPQPPLTTDPRLNPAYTPYPATTPYGNQPVNRMNPQYTNNVHPSYPQNYGNYPSYGQPGYGGVPSGGNMMNPHGMMPQSNEKLFHEAINLCIYLKTNRQDENSMRRLNQLLKDPIIKARVDEYLKTMKYK